ncbi:uncharacterized protein LOC115928110 [Strongylocentrotus purpuratus]|uniref:Uncharacterized protein n=1 Tax=Strongylocentrotus purpuratus TaxID=7668 RepID=A0A7M7PEZ3_STRPU|nr:uncharacterized protein LOC115928110 [Strongylocentrotus purpuratus]
MPNLTELTLRGENFQKEFFITLNAKASTLQVQTLILEDVKCPTSASSHHLAEALCSMPNLTELTLRGENFQKEFFITLNAKASTLQVQTLILEDVKCPTSASSHHLAEALCSMPNLTELTLRGENFQKEFFITLNAKASTLQVQTLILEDVKCPTSASSHHLAEALCSMPNLTELTLRRENFQKEFFITLNAKVHTLSLKGLKCLSSPSSHHLADALCYMPNLSKLILRGEDFQEEFFTTMNAKASTLQDLSALVDAVYAPIIDGRQAVFFSHPRFGKYSSDLSEEKDDVSDEDKDEEEDKEDNVSDKEDDLSKQHNGSVHPSRSHSRIKCCSIV